LSYSAQLSGGGALPSWLTFDGSTRTFSGTPASDDVGTLTVEIIATDKGGASASEVFDLTINPSDDTNHAPTSITLSGEEVTENAKAGTSIGAIGGVDPDGDTLTFTLLDNAGGRFAIKNGELRVAAGAVIDFETASSFDVEIRATDAGGLTFDQVFTITVNDVPNEPIKGGPKNDTLTGTDGDDTMQGLGGNDTLEGGKGADELDGGTGQDIASYAGAESGVTVNLARPTKNAGDAAGDSYVGIEDIRGSGLADRLTGNNRENVIEGGTGDDILAGGGSSDLFVFGTDNGSDTITDFDGLGADHDVIDLSEAVGIVSMKDLFKNHIKVVGDDLMITDDTGDQIRLLGTDKADIAKADFLL
jgi:Ca2+-binding RTX toxin-like protein